MIDQCVYCLTNLERINEHTMGDCIRGLMNYNHELKLVLMKKDVQIYELMNKIHLIQETEGALRKL